MGAEQIGRFLTSPNMAMGLPSNGAAFYIQSVGYLIAWGSYGETGGSKPSDTHFAKGCLLINYGGTDDYQLYCNEGTGLGSAPTWTAVSALGA